MESSNQNRAFTREVFCKECKAFTMTEIRKVVSLRMTMQVKIWFKCLKCGTNGVKDINRNEFYNMKQNVRTHYSLD